MQLEISKVAFSAVHVELLMPSSSNQLVGKKLDHLFWLAKLKACIYWSMIVIAISLEFSVAFQCYRQGKRSWILIAIQC